MLSWAAPVDGRLGSGLNGAGAEHGTSQLGWGPSFRLQVYVGRNTGLAALVLGTVQRCLCRLLQIASAALTLGRAWLRWFLVVQ